MTLQLSKIAETAQTITLGWTPPAGIGGYVLYADGQAVSTGSPNLKDGSPRREVKFSKTNPGPPFQVAAVCRQGGILLLDVGTYSDSPLPPTDDHSHRFATFTPSTDKINGTFNRYAPAGTWWVPGSPPNGSAWPNGGGLHEIATPYGPGLNLVVVPGMDYVGSSPMISSLARFAGFHQDQAFWDSLIGKTVRLEWTWMWPSAGNPAGWENTWNTGEGFTFPTLTPQGQGVVGHLLHLDAGPPFRYRFGRHTFAAPNDWEFYLPTNAIPGFSFSAGSYHHIKLEMKLSPSADGYLRVYTDMNDGAGFRQWVNYTGVTLAAGWRIWSSYMNIRPPLNRTQTLHWINHRVKIT